MTIRSSPTPNRSQDPKKGKRHEMKSERRAWRLIAVGVVGVAFVGVALATSPTARPPVATTVPASALGTFAGYDWIGPVSTVAAEWRVPKITLLNTSDSSTWIGVQSPTGGFVQIGTTEDSTPALDAFNGGSAVDQGFWSDDTVEFHPQRFDRSGVFDQHVRAGDLISASIAEVSGGWRLRLHDARSGLSFDQTIPMTTSDFNETEWYQEDPTNTDTNEPLPYPRLSSVMFTHLSINGEWPVLGFEDAVWMSVPHRDFRVSGLRNDSFEVEPIRFDQAQAQFLAARAPYEDAARRFDNIENTWRVHPPGPAAALKTLAPFQAAERHYDQTLISHTWTGVSSAEVAALIRSNRLDLTALLALARAEPHPGPDLLTELTSARADKWAANSAIDVALGLPG
jgi:hypothetical protein